MCVCVCVCVCERRKERQRLRQNRAPLQRTIVWRGNRDMHALHGQVEHSKSGLISAHQHIDSLWALHGRQCYDTGSRVAAACVIVIAAGYEVRAVVSCGD